MRIDYNDLPLHLKKQVDTQLCSAIKQLKETKYHSKDTVSGGVKFRSKAEAKRYEELMLVLALGQISKLKLQPTYNLQNAYTTPQGTRIRAITYTPDFEYVEGGRTVCEDVKGGEATKTKEYKRNVKMFRERYPEIEFREVTR